MDADPATGWQTLIADLSIILFMLTAASISAQPVSPARPVPRGAVVAAEPEPVAVWRDAPGAMPLRQWLDSQAGDPRIGFSVVVHYADGNPQAAATRAMDLAQQAGRPVRILLEPAEVTESMAMARYDRPGAGDADIERNGP